MQMKNIICTLTKYYKIDETKDNKLAGHVAHTEMPTNS
jgi:hypothetical protein